MVTGLSQERMILLTFQGNTRSSYQLHRFLQELSISADLTELDGVSRAA